MQAKLRKMSEVTLPCIKRVSISDKNAANFIKTWFY